MLCTIISASAAVKLDQMNQRKSAGKSWPNHRISSKNFQGDGHVLSGLFNIFRSEKKVPMKQT